MSAMKIPVTEITMMVGSSLVILAIMSLQIPHIYAGQQQQNASGWGQSVLPGDIPTLFSFEAIKHENGTVSGNFECFAVMPDGNTMYVNGKVTDLTIAANETSATLTGPTTVTGFGAGKGTFEAIVTQGYGGTANGTLILTTDVNGDGIQGNMPDGSEGPFNENIIKGSIKLSP